MAITATVEHEVIPKPNLQSDFIGKPIVDASSVMKGICRAAAKQKRITGGYIWNQLLKPYVVSCEKLHRTGSSVFRPAGSPLQDKGKFVILHESKMQWDVLHHRY
jgi:hypothetical protein